MEKSRLQCEVDLGTKARLNYAATALNVKQGDIVDKALNEYLSTVDYPEGVVACPGTKPLVE